MSFRDILAQLRDARAQHREQRRRDIRFPRRADVVAIVLLLVLATGATVAGSLLGAVEQAQGLFDPPLAEPLRDDRILPNIRPHPEPYVDATVVPADDTLYAIRRSGTVHRLNLSTLLWSGEEELRQLTPDLTTNVVLLQPGCGHQAAEASVSCKTDDTLFAVTGGGGVAMRRGGRWTMLLGDTQFKGRDGLPVKAEEIRSAVVTSDRELLLLGTRTQGIGIFDLVRRNWRRLPPDIDARLAPNPGVSEMAITQMVPDGKRILVGTSHGLFHLDYPSKDAWQIAPVENVAGRVIDIVTTRDRPLVLSGESCRNTAADECIALRRIPERGAATLVVGEVERLATLNDASIFHVAQSGAEILAYGPQGIFAYIVAERRWEQRETRPVTQVWQAATGGRLAYAHAEEVVVVDASGTKNKRALTGVRQIVAGAGSSGMPLALTETNQVYRLSETGDPRPILDDSIGRYPLAEYDTAVDIADIILFLGPNGALIHDPRQRTYRVIEKGLVPPALLVPRIALKATGNVLWLAQGSTLSAFALDPDPANPALTEIGVASVAGPPRSLAANSAKSQTLLVVDRDGMPFEASVDRGGPATNVRLAPLLGPQPGVAPGTIVDAVVDSSAAIVAANQGGRDGVWRYDLAQRGWSGPYVTGLGSEPLAGLAMVGTQPFALGAQGSVVASGSATAARLLGADTPLPFDSSDLTDAMAAPPLLALAGRVSGSTGAVVVYDIAVRRIVSTFVVATPAPRIAGFVNGLPVVYDGSSAVLRRTGAWLGSESLTVDGARAISASVRDGQILTVHRDNKGRVFLAERGGQGRVCVFRQPDLMAKDILDVRELSGQLAFLTDRGLRLYSPADRRFSAEADTFAGARLALFRHHLVTYDGGNARLIPLSGQGALAAPSSCDSTPLAFAAQRLSGRQVAVDEARSRIAILGANGEVGEWNGGHVAVLPAANDGPEPRSLRRLVQRGDEVHFASLTAVSTYNLLTRQWRSARIAMPASAVVDVGLTLIGQSLALTATDKEGQQYLGMMSGAPTITLARISQKAIAAAPFDPGALVDVQELQPHLWAFLSDRELSILDARQRVWTRRITFDRPSTQRRLQDWNTHWAITDGEARPGRIGFIPKASLPDATNTPTPASSLPSSALSSIAFIHEPVEGEKFAIVEAATAATTDKAFELLRWLPDDQVLACPLARPGLVTGCVQRLRPAVLVTAADVRAAFSWADQTLYYTDPDRFWLVDRRARLPMDLTDAIAKHGFGFDPRDVVSEIVDGDLWLKNANGRTIAITKKGVTRLLLEDSQDLFAAHGRIWAITQTGLRLYRGDAFLPPAATLGAIFPGDKISSASIDRDGLAVGVRADETIVYETGNPRIASSLKRSTDTLLQVWSNWNRPGFVDPHPLQRGAMDIDGDLRDGWWIRDGDQVHFVAKVPCVLPDPRGRIDSGCEKIAVSYRLPPAPSIVAEIGNEMPPTFTLTENGVQTAYRGPQSGGNLAAIPNTPPQRRAGDRIADSLDGFRRSIATNNQLDHIQLRLGLDNRFDLRYGAYFLTAKGSLSGSDVAALDRDWIKWRRAGQKFQLRNPAGQSFEAAAADLFPDGIFAPSAPGKVLPVTANEIAVANANGVWRWTPGGDLVDRGPSWQRFEGGLPPVVAATNARFYFDRESLARDGRAVEPDSNQVEVRRQDLRLVETVRGSPANVAATLTVGGQPVDDFGPRGFLHDQRQSIAFDGSGIVLLSPVGIVGTTGYGDVVPPPFPGAASAQLFAHDRALHAIEKPGAGDVLKWTPAGWTQVADPRLNAVLYKDATWSWTRAAGRVVLDGADWRTAQRDWSFNADTVVGAAYGSGEIVMMSEDGTRTAARFADLAQGRAASIANPPARGERVVETRFAQPGVPVVGTVDNDGMGQIWSPQPQAWNRPTAPADPDRQRSAVEGNFLQIAFTQKGSTIALQAEHPTAGRTSIPVTWPRGRPFPFDFAHAIGGEGGRLFIATSSALQIVDVANSRRRIVDTRRTAQGLPRPLSRIGRPADAPQRFLAQGQPSTGDCLEIAGPTPVFCDDANPLAERTLGATSFWSWTFRDTPTMRYLDRAGLPASREIRSLPLEGFPHDRLKALQTCGGQTVALWNDGALAIEFDSAALAIGPRTATDVLLPARMDRLHCQARPVNLGGPAGNQLPAGTFALQGASALQLGGGGGQGGGRRWVAATGDLGREVAARAADRYPFERDRLRLRRNTPQAGLTLEYLTLANTWTPLRTNGRRYAIDERAKLLVSNGEVWAATGDGLVRFDRTADLLTLDPDSLTIATMPGDRATPCIIDRIEQADGSGIALAPVPAKPVVLRCTDGKVFVTSALGAADDGGLRPLPAGAADPFHERLLLAAPNGALKWHIQRPTNTAGRLRLEWQGEETSLTAGRFTADALRSVA
ncbi:MAG: hypothetical protein NTV97_20610, partial [Alphaproteobacteria bacterium]|nr:hypothetical protein [Alphaproteobacteria bacterium]